MSAMVDIRVEMHTITTRDGTRLGATLYRPKEHNQHVVLIAGAMGMPQRFYRHYANFLTEHGCVVLTFDYRGIGTSRPKESLWGDTATLTDWASQDIQAMLKWFSRQYPNSAITVIGHSLGGHLIGVAECCGQVTAIIGVSAQSTYWRHWSGLQQIPMFIFWFIFLPILSHALGYFPSSWFGLGEPLPKQVALNWAQGAGHTWGNKGLFINTAHDHYDNFTGHTLFYSFTDDTQMAPKRSVDAILDYYPQAKSQQRRHVSPESIGQKSIGHSQFFRPQMRETLWQESLNFVLNPTQAVDPIITDDAVQAVVVQNTVIAS